MEILEKPLGELGFSPDFVSQSLQMGLQTLGAIKDVSVPELLRHPGFSHLWLEELSVWLQQHKLMELLQPLPGNSAL